MSDPGSPPRAFTTIKVDKPDAAGRGGGRQSHLGWIKGLVVRAGAARGERNGAAVLLGAFRSLKAAGGT